MLLQTTLDLYINMGFSLQTLLFAETAIVPNFVQSEQQQTVDVNIAIGLSAAWVFYNVWFFGGVYFCKHTCKFTADYFMPALHVVVSTVQITFVGVFRCECFGGRARGGPCNPKNTWAFKVWCRIRESDRAETVVPSKAQCVQLEMGAVVSPKLLAARMKMCKHSMGPSCCGNGDFFRKRELLVMYQQSLFFLLHL